MRFSTNRPSRREELPGLEIGTQVRCTIQEHPWYGRAAEICDKKHKHYRIEIEGRKVWVPEYWVDELTNTTQRTW